MDGKVLLLPMTRKWFDMVKSGEKKEEYRLCKPYWISRINNWMMSYFQNEVPFDDKNLSRQFVSWYFTEKIPIVFFNGYRRDHRMFKAYCDMVSTRMTSVREEWGENAYDGSLHFAIHICKVEG